MVVPHSKWYVVSSEFGVTGAFSVAVVVPTADVATAPAVGATVMRPSLFVAASANQSRPSAPVAIPSRSAADVSPALNTAIDPDGVTRPITFARLSVK